MTPNDAYEFFVELVSQLFHADVLITDQAERLEAENERLRTTLAETKERPRERRPADEELHPTGEESRT